MTDSPELIKLLRDQKEQRNYIIAAIIAVGAFLGWVLWPTPDFSNMGTTAKCSYWRYYKDNGGSEQECLLQAAVARLRGHGEPR